MTEKSKVFRAKYSQFSKIILYPESCLFPFITCILHFVHFGFQCSVFCIQYSASCNSFNLYIYSSQDHWSISASFIPYHVSRVLPLAFHLQYRVIVYLVFYPVSSNQYPAWDQNVFNIPFLKPSCILQPVSGILYSVLQCIKFLYPVPRFNIITSKILSWL